LSRSDFRTQTNIYSQRVTHDPLAVGCHVTKENHFVFTPMLAEAVGRSISPDHVVIVGRQMVRRTIWLTAQVTDIDLQSNLVSYVGAGGESAALTYDHLVLACGSVVNMNMVPGLAAYAYPLKTLGDAIYHGKGERESPYCIV
jgi:NADH:quinone reductase (non-electrogenic)